VSDVARDAAATAQRAAGVGSGLAQECGVRFVLFCAGDDEVVPGGLDSSTSQHRWKGYSLHKVYTVVHKGCSQG